MNLGSSPFLCSVLWLHHSLSLPPSPLPPSPASAQESRILYNRRWREGGRKREVDLRQLALTSDSNIVHLAFHRGTAMVVALAQGTPQDPVGTLLAMAQSMVLGTNTPQGTPLAMAQSTVLGRNTPQGTLGPHLVHITKEAEERGHENGKPELGCLADLAWSPKQNLLFLINSLPEAIFYS